MEMRDSTRAPAKDLGHYGKTIKFASSADRDKFLEDLNARNVIYARFGADRSVVRYDTDQHDLAGHIRRLVVEKGIASKDQMASISGLGQLHRVVPPAFQSLDESELNKMSQFFYDTDEPTLRSYRAFIREAVAPLFECDLLFQATPTVRFHFPQQQGFNWRPRYHTDIMLGHPPREVNVWVPLTRTFGSNSMRIAGAESSLEILRKLGFDFEDLALRVQRDDPLADECEAISAPVELEYGEFLLFDPLCLHATQHNATDATRVSIDFRVVPRDEFAQLKREYRGTGRRQMLFAPGYYYDARSIAQL